MCWVESYTYFTYFSTRNFRTYQAVRKILTEIHFFLVIPDLSILLKPDNRFYNVNKFNENNNIKIFFIKNFRE